MAIVMPRARSSGALSIESNERYSASPFIANTFVIAAVSVVFPWSTCPIVPTFTCGFVRSNLALAISFFFVPQLKRAVTDQLGPERGPIDKPPALRPGPRRREMERATRLELATLSLEG